MAQILIRNLEDHWKLELARRARCNGRSPEQEAREILRAALRKEDDPSGGLGSDIAALFRENGLDSEILELRGHVLTTPPQSDSCD